MKASLITTGGGVLLALITFFAGVWHPGDSKQNASSLNVPMNISITSPTDRVTPAGDTDNDAFSGQVQGLKPGQTIWLFSKQITDPKNNAINQGPCNVTGDHWDCPKMRVGGQHNVKDNGNYRVWAAIEEPWQVRELVSDLTDNKSVYRGNADQPPYAGPGGLFRETVTRCC